MAGQSPTAARDAMCAVSAAASAGEAARDKKGPKTKLLSLVPRKGSITLKALAVSKGAPAPFPL